MSLRRFVNKNECVSIFRKISYKKTKINKSLPNSALTLKCKLLGRSAKYAKKCSKQSREMRNKNLNDIAPSFQNAKIKIDNNISTLFQFIRILIIKKA